MGETDNFVNIILSKYNRNDIKVIYDMGSRDGLQALEFKQHFPMAKVYAFECNPLAIELCRANLRGSKVELIEYALSDKAEPIKFYPVAGNIGASSAFKKTGKYDHIENYNQLIEGITVPAIRLDSRIKMDVIEAPDVLWADMQGSELNAFKGLGDYMKNVKAIFTEAEYQEMYEGQPLFPELDAYIKSFGFVEKWRNSLFGDFWGEVIYLK